MEMLGVDIWNLWWVWLAAALLLGLLEVVAPGFIFLGFAIGAAGTALVVLLPIGLGLAGLLAIFALLSLISWAVLRRVFRGTDNQSRIIHEDINK
jgi:membrane protein implicated in regulation of membrane protease activity